MVHRSALVTLMWDFILSAKSLERKPLGLESLALKKTSKSLVSSILSNDEPCKSKRSEKGLFHVVSTEVWN